MVKKKMTRVLATILAAGLLLTGCGSQKPEETTEAKKDINYEQVLSTLKPAYDNEKAVQMENFTYSGMVYIEGNTYYGKMSVKDKEMWQFVKMELVDDPESPSYKTSGDWDIVSEDVVPLFINKVGDTFYFVAQDWTKDPDNPEYSIDKVSVSGGDRTKVCDGSSYLMVKNDKLYFTDKDSKYVCTDLEGKNQEVIIDKEVYYPYWIDDSWIIYQDDADNESLHVYNVSEKVDIKLNDEPSYNPMIFDNSVYFVVYADENQNSYHLAKIDLTNYTINGDDVTFTMEKSDKLMGNLFRIDYNEALGGEEILGQNGSNGRSIDKWQEIEDTAYEFCSESYMYVGDDYDAYMKFNEEGQSATCIMNKETGYGQSIKSLE